MLHVHILIIANKTLLALVLVALHFSCAGAVAFCDADYDSPNALDRSPAVGTAIGSNEWTTFSAAASKNCGFEPVCALTRADAH